MQLLASILLMPSGSFGIFLRNLESLIKSLCNLSNLLMLSWRFKSLPSSEWVKQEINFFRKFNHGKQYLEELASLAIPTPFGNWTLP